MKIHRYVGRIVISVRDSEVTVTSTFSKMSNKILLKSYIGVIFTYAEAFKAFKVNAGTSGM